MSTNKPKRFQHHDYWSGPVPSFGDTKAELLVIGLAPAINGGNITGRMFTGDSTGDWLIRALFETGFASAPHSYSANDGLELKKAYITSSVKCAPPMNKPTLQEIYQYSIHLKNELRLLDGTLKVIVTLGHVAFNSFCRITDTKRLKFNHGASYQIGDDKYLLVS